MNENIPCTTNSSAQTLMGLLYLAAVVLAVTLIVLAL